MKQRNYGYKAWNLRRVESVRGAVNVSRQLRQRAGIAFDLGGPWALLFSKAPLPHPIIHIKTHPLCISNEFHIAI